MNLSETKYFNLSEFKGVEPDPRLLAILHGLRLKTGPVTITDGPRTVLEHVNMYKKIHGNYWLDKIPWGSRHLARFGTQYLEAVDLKAVDSKGNQIPGSDLHEIVVYIRESIEVQSIKKDILHKTTLSLGIGKGNNFIHLDVRRNKDTFWEYSY